MNKRKFRKKLLSMEVAAIAATGMIAGTAYSGPVIEMDPVHASFQEVDLAESPFSSIADTLLDDYSSAYGGASVELVDLDGDGDKDLVLGDRYSGPSQGPRYFQNNGTGFSEVTDTAANPIQPMIDEYGYNKSFDFIDLDEDGDLDAIMGIHQGFSPDYDNPQYWENVGTATAPSFEARNNYAGGCGKNVEEAAACFTTPNTDSNPFQIYTYYGTHPAFADIDDDDEIEGLVMGDYQAWFVKGNVTDGFVTNSLYANIVAKNAEEAGKARYSNFNYLFDEYRGAPSFADIDGDGDNDLIIHEYNDVQLDFYANNGVGGFEDYGWNPASPFIGDQYTQSCSYTTGTYTGQNIVTSSYSGTTSGTGTGTSTSTATSTYSYSSSFTESFSASTSSTGCGPVVQAGSGLMFTAFADMDDDGDLDMLVGDQMSRDTYTFASQNNIRYYENTFSGPRLVAPIDVHVTEDVDFSIDLNDHIEDGDGGVLTFTVTLDGSTAPNTDGVVTGNYGQDAVGTPINVVVTAEDDEGITATFTGTITVDEVNDPPMQVSDFDDITLQVGDVTVIDLNNYFEDEEDELEYTITVDGTNVQDDDGIVSFVFDNSAVGTHALSLEVSDGVNDSLTLDALITVEEREDPLTETNEFVAGLNANQEAADLAAALNAQHENDEDSDGLVGSTPLWSIFLLPLLWIRRKLS